MSDRRFLPCLLALLVFPLAAGAHAQTTPEPLTLPRAVEMALARAPEVAVAQAESDLAGASAGLARSRSGLEAFVATNPGYSSGLPVIVAGQVPSVVNVSVRQPIYDPSLKAGLWTARAAAEERQSALERAQSETARAVILAYGRVVADGTLLAGARRALEAREAMARRASSLAAEGRATPVDSDAAYVEVARAKQRLLDRTLARELDEFELKGLLDWPSGKTLTLAEDALGSMPPPGSGNGETTARAADPETLSLEREIQSLRAAAAARSKRLQPTVQAEAQYLRLAKYNHFDDYFRRFRENDFSVGVSISIPLWSSGRTEGMAAEARARVARAEASLRGRAREVDLAIRRGEADLARAASQEAVARSAEAVARERARIGSALAAEGRGDADGAELADLALIRAREEVANASQAVLAAQVSLLASRGELVSSLVAPRGSGRAR
ncbi:MAG: TolC family protein [Acidobacteria bacterium]|nr:TolC family protein [Acidobacteriota bacterium]MCA1609923.1 TolC family protein [Acidobacteriota bacterium]